MAKIKQQKKTELQNNLAKKTKQLRDKIKALPAYPRRKKDEKNWETFFVTFAFISLTGIMIFGTGGWLAVAVSGTLLTLIIVEAGLFSSLAIGFSAWPMYNTYLWIRDLFSSEKTKSQNKDFDQCYKNLLELKALAAEKSDLMVKINAHLKNAIQCLPSNLSSQEETEFFQLSLTKQIEKLEKEKQILPAYFRKQADKGNWDGIFLFSMLTSCVGFPFCFIIMLTIPVPTFLGPALSFLIFHLSIEPLNWFGPVTFGSLLHGAYVYTRDLFSSAEIKAENKQYAQFTKTIRELKKLDKQNSQLDATINSKLQMPVDALTQTTDQPVKEKFLEFSENKKPETVYKLFPEPTTPANQKQLLSEQKSSGHVAFFRH